MIDLDLDLDALGVELLEVELLVELLEVGLLVLEAVRVLTMTLTWKP